MRLNFTFSGTTGKLCLPVPFALRVSTRELKRCPALKCVCATTLVIAVIGALSPCYADVSTPEEFLASVYRNHQPWQNKEISFADPTVLSIYFDQELTRLFLREDQCKEETQEICNLDFDPIYCAQDFAESLEGFKVTERFKKPPTYDVTFTNLGTRTVRYVLGKTTGGWRIADIQCPESWSLKKILEQPLP